MGRYIIVDKRDLLRATSTLSEWAESLRTTIENGSEMYKNESELCKDQPDVIHIHSPARTVNSCRKCIFLSTNESDTILSWAVSYGLNDWRIRYTDPRGRATTAMGAPVPYFERIENCERT